MLCSIARFLPEATIPARSFSTCVGVPSARQLTALVGNLTARFGGCRMTPAMIRRLFALGWQAEKSHDYYTLSRVLGRANVRSMIHTFRNHLSVSDAMRKV
jgi:hypothetical protein